MTFHWLTLGLIVLQDKDPLVVGEVGLLEFKFFDDIKFAKQISELYEIPYIDLARAKIPERTLQLVKKSDIIKYRAIPIQKNSKEVSIAIYDPSIKKLQSELQTLFQHPVSFILTNLSAWGSSTCPTSRIIFNYTSSD